MSETRYVYVIWKDYGAGDHSMLAVHETKKGARQRVRELYFEAKSKDANPLWNDNDKSSFKSDMYEVETQAVPLAS